MVFSLVFDNFGKAEQKVKALEFSYIQLFFSLIFFCKCILNEVLISKAQE